MPFQEEDVISWEYEEGTPGGVTNYVTLKSHPNEARPYCGRKLRARAFENYTGYCQKPAGFATWHSGEGACKMHGGNAGGKSTTGVHSKRQRYALAARVDDYMNNDKQTITDITYELSALRVICRDLIEDFPSPDDELKYKAEIDRLQNVVGVISSTLEKISRIESRNVLTISEVMYLQARIETMFTKYIRDPELRKLAYMDLKASLPSNPTAVKDTELWRESGLGYHKYTSREVIELEGGSG